VSATRRAGGTPWFPKGEHVLVVEDEVVLQRLMQEVLCTHFGCYVELAANGAEALALIDKNNYAVVLTDIRMPQMSGTEFYQRLRQKRPEMANRVVFVSGHIGDKPLEAEIAHWNVPVLAKPYSLEQLSNVCRPFFLAAAERHANV
jgi:CheY-like chemotaxis protein